MGGLPPPPPLLLLPLPLPFPRPPTLELPGGAMDDAAAGKLKKDPNAKDEGRMLEILLSRLLKSRGLDICPVAEEEEAEEAPLSLRRAWDSMR